jgi:hypothetical protein
VPLIDQNDSNFLKKNIRKKKLPNFFFHTDFLGIQYININKVGTFFLYEY